MAGLDDPAFYGDRWADAHGEHHVARVLGPGGAFIIECIAPSLARFDRRQRVETLEVAEDAVTFELSCNDAAQQRSPLRLLP